MVSLYFCFVFYVFCFVFYVLCFMLNSFRDVGISECRNIDPSKQSTRQLVNSSTCQLN